MRSRKYIRLALINAVVLMTLFALVEVIAMVYLEVLFVQESSEKDPRGALSVYENEPWADTYFEEKKRSLSAYQSYYGWKRLPFKGETIYIDRNGRRKTSEIAGAIGLPIRVAFLGGSTMLGVGSRDHETIPSQFVTQGKGKYKAVNYGEGAFSAYQSYIYYQTEILKGGRKTRFVDHL